MILFKSVVTRLLILPTRLSAEVSFGMGVCAVSCGSFAFCLPFLDSFLDVASVEVDCETVSLLLPFGPSLVSAMDSLYG